MNTVKILVHKELATTFNSWSIYIGYTLFFCVCGFFSWLSSNNDRINADQAYKNSRPAL